MDEFYSLFKDDTLVVLKWLTQQTAANVPGNLPRVKDLLDHPAFNISNPNSCYSLFGGFFQSPVTFHAADGSGYEFLGDAILKVGLQSPLSFVQTAANVLLFDPAPPSLPFWILKPMFTVKVSQLPAPLSVHYCPCQRYPICQSKLCLAE